MLQYYLDFSASLFEEIFTNELLEILPGIFLFVVGLSLLNLVKHSI